LICSTSAIVLNYRKYSDTSLICNLYSKDYGKFSIIAKGARSLKNPHGSILQPLNYIDLIYYFKQKRNIQLFKEASMVKKHYHISENYKKMIYGLTIVDIINFSSYNDSPCHIIFRLLTKCLEQIDLSAIKYLDYYYLFFNIQLLIYLGYHPILEKCYNCNNELKSGNFDQKHGQLLCQSCSQYKEKVSIQSVQLMKMLSKTHINQISNNFIFSEKILTNVKEYLFKFILYHIHEIKKSKAFITFNT